MSVRSNTIEEIKLAVAIGALIWALLPSVNAGASVAQFSSATSPPSDHPCSCLSQRSSACLTTSTN